METHFPEMEDATGTLARERVLTDLRTLARDAEALLRATTDDASDQARDARARLAAAIEKARQTYERFQQQSIASAKQAAQNADDAIRAHPYESIALAVGVGVLIGALLRRR